MSKRPRRQRPSVEDTAAVDDGGSTINISNSHNIHKSAQGSIDSNTSSSSSSSTNILLQLSAACNKHRSFHFSSNNSNNNHHPECNFPHVQPSQTPQHCRNNLASLGKALPKLENSFRAARSNNSNRSSSSSKGGGGPAPEDVRHICDFYRDVLAGGFCPHAPHLFQLGRGAVAILPRVHYLLEHIVSRSIISNTIATIQRADENTATETYNNQTRRSHVVAPVADTITETLARLLHAVPEPHLQACLLRDFLNLAYDLTLLLMPDEKESASSQPLPWIVVEVVLMEETVRQCGILGEQQQQGREQQQGTQPAEYVLTLASADAAMALLTAVYQTIATWMQLQKEQRLGMSSSSLQGEDSYADLVAAQAAMVSPPPSSMSIPSDLYFFSVWSYNNDDDANEIFSDLRAALGQILLSSSSEPPTSSSSNSHQNAHRSRLLFWKCQAAAARIGSALVHDAARSMDSSPSEIIELSLISVRAARQYVCYVSSQSGTSLQGSTSRKGSSSISLSPFCSARTTLAEALAKLVSDAILVLPASTTTNTDLQSMVQRATVPTLLDCVSCILVAAQKESSVSPSFWSSFSDGTHGSSHRELARILFSALYQALQSNASAADFVSMTILTHPSHYRQVLPNLFKLLVGNNMRCTDSFILETAVKILAAILRPANSDNNDSSTTTSSWRIVVNLQNVCRWCITESEREGNSNFSSDDDNDRSSPPSAGSKRKSSSSMAHDNDANDSTSTGKQNKRLKSCDEDDPASQGERVDMDCAVPLGKAPDSNTVRSLEEELAQFLLQACRSMKNLRQTTSQRSSSSVAAATAETSTAIAPEFNGHIQKPIIDVLTVSNALQLLLLLLTSDHTSSDGPRNSSSALVLLKMLVAVLLELFDSFRVNGELRTPKEGSLKLLWDAAAQCAKTVTCEPFGNSVLEELFRPLVLFVMNDLWAAQLLDGHNGLSMDTLLVSVDTDDEKQEWRLRLLTRCQAKTPALEASISLQQRTFDVVDNFDRERSDPRVRLLWWQSTAWLFLSATKPQELRRILTNSQSSSTSAESSNGESLLLCGLLTTAFIDSDSRIRDYTSRELGRFLMANDQMAILAALARNDEWRDMWASQVQNAQAKVAAVGEVISRFFKAVDKLLYQHCQVPQSELSFTVAPSDPVNKGTSAAQSQEHRISNHRAAVRCILSMCEGLNTSMHGGRIVLQQSLMRVIRLRSSHGENHRIETSGLSFGEISRTFRQVGVQNLLQDVFMECFTPALFQDVLAPRVGLHERSEIDICNIPLLDIERQYRMLLVFIQQFLVGQSHGPHAMVNPSGDSAFTKVGAFLEKWLPFVIAQMVVDRDHKSLCLTTGFKLFLLAKQRDEDIAKKRSKAAIYSDLLSDRLHTEKLPSKNVSWNRDLENQTRKLCLAPNLTDRIISLLLKGAEQPELVFYTKVVLQGKLSLKAIISSRETLMLKELVRELGRSRTGTEPAVKAIKTAATALTQPDDSSSPAVNESSTAAACDWISTNFMYVLVNVVHAGWAQKDEAGRVQAVRCLKSILPFLHAKEAAQYFPQIMATVNTSISQRTGAHEGSRELCLIAELRYLAVGVLVKFVRLVAQQQMEAIGEHLTSVVVSLIPVIAEDERCFSDRCVDRFRSLATSEAVALLEFLSDSDRGRNLVRFWKEIPFLPQTPALDPVRANLQKIRVDFDNLLATDTQMTSKRDTFSSASKQSEGGSASGDSRSASSSPKKLLDLRKRLEMICSFLGNENASIRRVFLGHLISLLRSHRDLFLCLVDNERSDSIKRFLTRIYPQAVQLSRGIVTEMVTTLLSRCVRETDPDNRVLLATCFGEVGAIAEQRLEVSVPTTEQRVEVQDNAYDAYDWRLQRPPWQTSPAQYELQLVTKDLVTTMKAAPESSDQHKVAFAVQQLLVLLDEAAKKGDQSSSKNELRDDGRKPPMSQKLSKALAEAGVLDKVEPFWFSEFREEEQHSTKQPPFFRTSRSYFSWLSNWCRYMVHQAHASRKSEWTMCFHACRTALRTHAAVSVAEFLLPILVLDRMHFGNGHDEKIVIQEIKDALTFGENGSRPGETLMSHRERQKAVSVIFSLIDTFQAWSERVTNERSDLQSRSGNGRRSTDANSEWQLDESMMRIEDVLQAIPLSLQAHAAADVGMHARALRLLETASRATVADDVFGADPPHHFKATRSRACSSGSADNLQLMKKTLAALNDHDTMVSLEEESIVADPLSRALEAVRRREANGDWNGALQTYERAQQLAGPENRNVDLHTGALQCLLELGHFESVLNQVKGILNTSETKGEGGKTIPFAIEAAWRLGRWDTLSEMSRQAATTNLDPDGRHRLHVGQTMLAVHDGNLKKALTELKDARIAVMDKLSSAAQESYTRSYDQIVKLHCLREVEDAAHVICVTGEPSTLDSFARCGDGNWERRLDLAAPDSAVRIINTRLALARLARDSSLEGSLFLGMGKRAREKGDFNIANNAFSQAEGAFDIATCGRGFHLEKCSLQMEIARLRHATGEVTGALQILAIDDVEGMADLDEPCLRSGAVERVRNVLRITEPGMDEDQMIQVFVQRALQSTEWMIQGGLIGGSVTMNRFRTIFRVDPKWEKGHFQYAKYIESAIQSRMTVLQRRFSRQRVGVDEDLLRSHTFVEDRACQKYLLLAVKHYMEALSLELTHLYQALPRLLYLWFDFTSTSAQASATSRAASDFTPHRTQPSLSDALRELTERQKELNVFMAKEFTRVPTLAFYTALPQLISRMSTKDQSDGYLVVRTMLRRVLAKFPAQAMWALAWVRQSKDASRREVGNEIFQEAERSQLKNRNRAMHKLLVASKSLFRYLLDLAQLNVKTLNRKDVKIKPWVGEVELAEFIPPVQAALSPSSIPVKYNRTTDPFPRHVPRMKAFSRNVGLMTSKARPKKLKAVAVSGDPSTRTQRSLTGEQQDCHLGEIHFLVKQEAKGDLRKDARVQDLNNVINRLLASSGDGSGSTSRQRRRLHLRTFAVTCLSEDAGILEWVPHTTALRNLIIDAYNPQAPALSSKRKGRNMTNPADPILRKNYEKKCQDMYFVSHDLKRAAALFEELLLKPNPPLLHWWFVQHYRNPHDWYEARTRFAESAAVWSAVGHVIGLGDRHAENILVDTTRGEIVHVDFDCIFDKGLNLPKPEVVPFRLTANMIDAFGPTGADGIYSGSLKDAMSTLRDNRDTLLSVLEPFLKDPIIDWKRTRSQQQKMRTAAAAGVALASTQDRQTTEAKRSIHVIDERLRGVYNLRNPNHRKIRRAQGMSGSAAGGDEEHDEMTQLMPLNVSGQVHKMIAEATSNENLVQLFVGWMPWV